LQSVPDNIEVFHHGDIDEVAEIFRNELPDDFCSLLGSGFLRGYFLPHFLATDPHIGYVARHDGRVVGFSLAARASGYYSNFIKNNFMGLSIYSLLACLRDIRRTGYFLDVLKVMFGSDAFRPFDDDLELLYLSVDSSHQGTGVGGRLVDKALQEGQQLGFNRCVLKTFPSVEGIQRFYLRCGFEPLHLNQGRIWYSKSLPALKPSV